MIKYFFISGRKISWYLQKCCSAEKSKLLEKLHHFEKFKNLFSWIQGLGIQFKFKQVSGSKIITQRLQVRLDVFAVFGVVDKVTDCDAQGHRFEYSQI